MRKIYNPLLKFRVKFRFDPGHILPLFADARRRGIVLPPWIVHGFRGGPALARQLLDAGFDLSFGLRYNKESFDITPTERRYRETDAL